MYSRTDLCGGQLETAVPTAISCFPSAVDLPCSPLVGVAAETDVAARDADVLKIALMKSSDVPRVDFGWVAVFVGQFAIDDTR